MNKKQLKKEKELVNEMEESYSSLSSSDKVELLRLKCRTDFITYAKFITNQNFKAYKVHDLIGSYLQKIGDGEEDYIQSAISLPPRTGKSMLISQIFPSWQLGRSPTAQFIMSSYALKLTKENAIALTNYVTSKNFSWIYPECKINAKKCNLTAIRSENGGLISLASAESGVTGFGYGVIDSEDLPGIGILDDLLADGNSIAKMESTFNWAKTQFLTRNLPNYAVISMGTRFHCDDVIGRLLSSDRENWKELNVPALCIDEDNDVLNRKLGESHWPEFFPVSDLMIKRKTIGEREFNSLYQGQPAGEAGAIFKDHWIETHSRKFKHTYVYATIDTGYKADNLNDYTAICIWGLAKDRSLKLIDVVMERLEFPELQKLIIKVAKNHKVRCIYIEGRANGVPLIQTLKNYISTQIKELVPSKDKVLRANSVAPIVEQGLISIYDKIPNLEERLNDLTSFPFIKNDDFVDAFVYGVSVYRDELSGGSGVVSSGLRVKLPKLNYNSETISRKSLSVGSLVLENKSRSKNAAIKYL
jgi:predicted phage terminase large subunit-like protein